jgi:hypothetical protein
VSDFLGDIQTSAECISPGIDSTFFLSFVRKVSIVMLFFKIRSYSSPGLGFPYCPSSWGWNGIRLPASLGGSYSSWRDRRPALFSFLSYLPQRAPLTTPAVVLILYTFLAVDFLIRFTLDKPMRRNREEGIVLPRGKMDGPIASMLIGLLAMLVFLLIRSTYRVIELAGGWEGKVISTQWLFSSSAFPFHPWSQRC